MTWKTLQLGDVANIVTGKSNREDSVIDGEYVFFDRSREIRRSSRFLFDTEAVIVPGEGKEFIPRYFSGRFDLHQRVYAIIDFQSVDGKFLYYTIAHKRGYFAQVAIGTTVKSLRKGMFERFTFECPPLDVQRRIVSALSPYDDLIENNWRRIQLLEKSARLLYKEWFLHLRFPGHDRVKVKDGVPTGWTENILGSFCDRKKTRYTAAHENLPLLDLGRINRRTLGVSETGKSSELKTSKIIFEADDVLFGSIRPYLHKVALAPCEGITNTSVFVVRPIAAHFKAFAAMLLSDNFAVAYANQHSTGTKMPVVKWDSLEKMPVLIPPKEVLDAFEALTSPMLAQIKSFYGYNQRLAETRDLLVRQLLGRAVRMP